MGVPNPSPKDGPGLLDNLKKYYNNSYDNLGNYDSFLWYGPRCVHLTK